VSVTEAARLPRVSHFPVAVTAWGKAAEWLTLAAMLTLIPRVLGPAAYGSFGLALGLVSLGSTAFALGGATVMTRFVAAAPPEDRAGLARALALRAVRWRAASLALLGVIVVVLVRIDPARFPPFESMIVLLAVILDTAATLAFQIALGFNRSLVFSFRYPVQNFFLVASVPLLYVMAGTGGALIAIALSSAIGLALGAWTIRGHLVESTSRVPAAVSRFALLQGLNGLLIQVLHRGGVVAVALFAGSRVQTGYAALVMGIAIASIYAVWQVFTVALPRLAELAADNVVLAGAQLRKLAGRIVLLSLPASVAAAFLAGPMLKLLAGGRFAPAHDALASALAAVPLAPITGAVGTAAALHLRPGARLWTTTAGAAVFAIVALVLVPSRGAAGASIALLAGTIVSALAGTIVFRDVLDRWLMGASFGASVLVLLIGRGW
jgi:O-antigen/teichoic acid export membrane protein